MSMKNELTCNLRSARNKKLQVHPLKWYAESVVEHVLKIVSSIAHMNLQWPDKGNGKKRLSCDGDVQEMYLYVDV